jgi:hypothetical protein
MNQSNSILTMNSTSSTSGEFTEVILKQTENVRIICKAEYARKDASTAPNLRLVFSKQKKVKVQNGKMKQQ